jgi:NADH-quinone oxidoreductase subunit N
MESWVSDKYLTISIVLEIIGLILTIYFLFVAQNSYNEKITLFEFPILIILAFFGMSIMVEATDLVVIFLALELQAFVYYTIIGLKQNSLFASEGALKYFLIGSLASALFILGTSYIYGYTSFTDLNLILDVLDESKNSFIFILGSNLILIALLFKIGAVPFHLWLPDAYQAASFYVLFFLIIFPKIFLFFLLYSINQLFANTTIISLGIFLSAIVGSFQAINQFKVKRFLAYTIIFNTSFFLSLTVLTSYFALFSLLFSLILYLCVSLLTLFLFTSIRIVNSNLKFKSLRDLLSIRKSNLFLAISIAIAFLSAAGMPPFIGFFQKFVIFLTLLDSSQYFLVLFLILSSILPAYYYIRTTKVIFFIEKSKWELLMDIRPFFAKMLGFFVGLSLFFILNPSIVFILFY